MKAPARDARAPSQARRGARPPRPPTPARLERSALHHLGRFAATRTELTRVLNRRTMRAIRAGLIDREEAARMVEATVAKVAAAGYLDDAAVARAKAGSMRRAGRSKRAIQQKLGTKGIARDAAEAALAAADADDDNAELRAAATLACRRKLGPYRTGKRDEATMKRDLAALARGGFSYAVARTVAAACSPETLAALLGDLD
ncbi:MAG: regulatory protein RecX [Gemmatimonas sp.]